MKIFARIGISLLAVPALYGVFITAACWTAECFKTFNPWVFATAIGFVVFAWLFAYADFPNP